MSDIRDAINEFADETDSDLLFYFGDIQRPEDDQLLRNCQTKDRHKNVVLLLTTLGGDPHAAYRIGRCLQEHYTPEPSAPSLGDTKKSSPGTFSVFINSVCKGAGTILTLGASKIYMTARAELGPIDIQLRKTDEVGERTSSLTALQALGYLENQSVALFKRHFTDLRFDEKLLFSTKMAADVATNITIGLLNPIYSQLDPVRLAEVDRYLRISSEYARRLATATKNVQPKALERLLADYPSHGLVIDRKEAEEIFVTVEEPPAKLSAIGEFFRDMASQQLESNTPFWLFANDWSKLKEEPKKGKEEEEIKENPNVPENSDGENLRSADGDQPAAHAGGGLKVIQKYNDGLSRRAGKA